MNDGFDRSHISALAIPISFALCLAAFVARAADPPGAWSIKSHLPEPRGETAMAAANGKLYVLGGATLDRELLAACGGI